MNVITCAECDGAATYRACADRRFACPAGHHLAPVDVDLDGRTEWAVDGTGTLGYVVSPSYSLDLIAEALGDLAESSGCADPEYARRAALDDAYTACLDYVAAYRCGVA
ncbi:hypothetical protein [Streptomyces sp. NPDC088785]|uniref:hypothetical protein n=1 Tax=Streptomyces sp. NPDC088785 TaxID=3365897 RepID=UPI0038074AB5